MKQIFSFIILLFIAFQSNANNVATSAVTLGPQNAASNFTMINYDISWENSWRTSTNESNYDGVWLFVKFRKNNTTNWQHATINYVAPGTAAACGHTQAAGSLIKTSADGKGIWQYRDADGVGAVFFAANSLRWNYGVDGVLDNDSVEVRVFAVEMVNIPQGAFALGSGSTTEANRFRNGASDTYMNITSEAAITVGLGAANIFGYGNSNMAAGSIPAAYPKGYNAFWIMKYELSQQSYVDFLNTIDFAAAAARNMGYTGVHPTFTATNPEWAADAVGTTDLLSWLDWAAMRPFTEFEYEKACRGANILPVADEYAWGNTNLIHIGGIQNAGTASESFTSGHCNYSYGILNRPTRCGAVATITSNRMQSGASYYGVMEMSGNVWERAIAAGYTEGRAFTGLHGDGNLNVTFTYNVANWPLIATGNGLTYRGGGYQSVANIATLQTSDRSSATSINVNTRSATYGGRGARTAE